MSNSKPKPYAGFLFPEDSYLNLKAFYFIPFLLDITPVKKMKWYKDVWKNHLESHKEQEIFVLDHVKKYV